MACIIVAVIALLLGNLHLGIGTDIENEDGAGEKSIAKQYVIAAPFGSQSLNVPSIYQPRPQFFPFNYQPQPQVIPFNYQPQPQIIPFNYQPQPQIIPFVSQSEPEPEITYEFVDPTYFNSPQPQPSRNSGLGTNLATFVALLLLMDELDATAAATTTTATPNPDDGCTYGEWGACSAFCKGTQSRNKICSGVITTETRDCNTEVGFLSNGWYRAANCYDYRLSPEELNFDDAESACEDLGAELASIGMRDTDIRREVTTALHVAGQTVFVYIGLERTGTDWVWLDGSTTVPNFWDVSEPDTAGQCAVLVSGNAESGHDANCASAFNSYCERPAT